MEQEAIVFDFVDSNAEEVYNGFWPAKAHENDTCFDLYATEDVNVSNDETVLIPLGVKFEIPAGWHAKLYARSSNPLKQSIMIPNGVGVIDEGYRGEVKMAAVKIGPGFTTIKKGTKIAQIEFMKREESCLIRGHLGKSKRGEGGFGSTGT